MTNEDATLLDALREELGVRSVKDGCSPQGQCGCCTVLIDGSARVACVTPVRRVAGRSVVTVDGLEPEVADRLVRSFVDHGAAQCGFCTPGILCRLAALGTDPSADQVDSALLAHLCRCTGWRTIIDAATGAVPAGSVGSSGAGSGADRRASIEGGGPQRGGPETVRGRGGFADDTAPPGCLVAVPAATGSSNGDHPDGAVEAQGIWWSVADSLPAARARSGKVQGRRSGHELSYPLAVPDGDWDITLQTTWVEPGYLEPDASWCRPGGPPASPVVNGGAFGAKTSSPVPSVARQLADQLGGAVRVVLSREDVVRLGPKRPPVAAGLRLDGTGVIRLAAPSDADESASLTAAVHAAGGGLEIELVPVTGPAVSASLRAAGWAEVAVLRAVARALTAGAVPGGPSAEVTVRSPEGAEARATVHVDQSGWPTEVAVSVSCGEVLDATVLRSYVVGASHMALGWVCSEAIAIGADGVPDDLTIRSFGILRAKDTPPITVEIEDSASEPVNGSDAVFAAVAAATWLAQGLPAQWPTRRGGRR